MRRAARVDGNQRDVVKELRAAGVTVQHLHTVGDGCPDLLAGFGRRNFVFEIKDPAQPPSKQRLTPDEEEWHENWAGAVYTIRDAAEALRIIRGELHGAGAA